VSLKEACENWTSDGIHVSAYLSFSQKDNASENLTAKHNFNYLDLSWIYEAQGATQSNEKSSSDGYALFFSDLR